MNRITSYKDLIAWQKAVELVTSIHGMTMSFPSEERFALTSQLNRATVSVSTNIAEGWGRESSKNYLHFLRIARGSIMEVETLLIISKNLKYISEEEFNRYMADAEEVGKILQGLIKSIHQKITRTDEVQS